MLDESRDVESGSVLTESVVTQQTGNTSDITGSSLPLILTSAYSDEQQRHAIQNLPKLPSHRFRYSVWHDLTYTDVKGYQLKAPRVRNGPPEKDKYFYRVRDENNQKIHHSRKGRERKDYRDEMEKWEIADVVNLSYQELGHGYQEDNFLRVLRRLMLVEDLSIIHNDLTDLSRVHLPRCKHINLNNNYLSSFKNLPSLPVIQFLTIDDNVIENLDGLTRLSRQPLEYLSLKGNPVTFTINYRQWVFRKLPNLQILDDVPRLPEDDKFEPEEDLEHTHSCIIT